MRLLFLGLFATIILSSCGGKLIYFQQKKESKSTYENIQINQTSAATEHIITTGDVLHIKLFSSNANLTNMFNNVLDEQNAISGYQVKSNGTIFIPYVGSVSVINMTIKAAESVVIDSLSHYISSPNLVLDFVAYQVVVLGEVKVPGPKLVPTDKATLIDIIALAGDLSQFGNPSNIKVIHHENGKKVSHFLDLSDIDVFKDDNFYIYSNDIVYVETLKRKFVQQNLTYISLLSTVLNVAVLISLRR